MLRLLRAATRRAAIAGAGSRRRRCRVRTPGPRHQMKTQTVAACFNVEMFVARNPPESCALYRTLTNRTPGSVPREPAARVPIVSRVHCACGEHLVFDFVVAVEIACASI